MQTKKKPRPKRRLKSLLLVALLVIPGSFAYIEFYLARPPGEGPAGPTVNADEFQSIWSDRQIQLIGIGDSITAGLGAKSKSHRFFNRLRRNPNDEFADMQGNCLETVLPNLKSENFAISGSESMMHLEVIQETSSMRYG